MSGYLTNLKHGVRWVAMGCAVAIAFGCAAAPPRQVKLPPLMTQEELLRPYDKVATIEVERERCGSCDDVAPDDYSWAYLALRQEAARIGADAVILPEVTIQTQTYTFWPISEMRAKGTAIKFH